MIQITGEEPDIETEVEADAAALLEKVNNQETTHRKAREQFASFLDRLVKSGVIEADFARRARDRFKERLPVERGPARNPWRWAFLVWNGLAGLWLLTAMAGIDRVTQDCAGEASCEAGAAVGGNATIALVFLVALVVNLILAVLLYVGRPRSADVRQ